MIKKFFEYKSDPSLEDLKELFSDLIDDGFQMIDWEFQQPPSPLSKINTKKEDIKARLEIPIEKISINGSTPDEVMKLLIKDNYTILGYLGEFGHDPIYLGNIQYEKFHNMESLNRIYQILDIKLIYISRRQIFNYNTNWSYQIDMIFRRF